MAPEEQTPEVTKKKMEYLRHFMPGQSIEVIDKFDKILDIM